MDSGFRDSSRVIKKSQVLPAGSVPPPEKSVEASLPGVRLREENSEIKAIEVHCNCGSKIVIDCDYSGAKAQGEGHEK